MRISDLNSILDPFYVRTLFVRSLVSDMQFCEQSWLLLITKSQLRELSTAPPRRKKDQVSSTHNHASDFVSGIWQRAEKRSPNKQGLNRGFGDRCHPEDGVGRRLGGSSTGGIRAEACKGFTVRDPMLNAGSPWTVIL